MSKSHVKIGKVFDELMDNGKRKETSIQLNKAETNINIYIKNILSVVNTFDDDNKADLISNIIIEFHQHLPKIKE